MPLTVNLVEGISAWCAVDDTLADVRSEARNHFFGYDEPGDISYMADAGEFNGRERRFEGWFGFDFTLLDGRHPAEVSADILLRGSELASALESIRQARFVTAVVTMVRPGRSVYLELEDEEFEVTSRRLSQALYRDDVLCAHILPVGRKRWLECPGWLVWPATFGPGIRSRLKNFQLDPIQVERFLQQRVKIPDGKPREVSPQDTTSKAAVARMTKEAKSAGYAGLVMAPTQWKKLVLTYLTSNDINGYIGEINQRIREVPSLEELNKWLGLAMNIWNNTPQPDRGGKTANELSTERRVFPGPARENG